MTQDVSHMVLLTTDYLRKIAVLYGVLTGVTADETVGWVFEHQEHPFPKAA